MTARSARRLAPLAACVLGVALSTGCRSSGDAPRLYVTSGFTDEVLILDATSGRILGRRSLDLRPGERDEPHGVAVAPDGRHWYATLAHGEPTLWKFETRDDRLVGRLTLPTRGAARVAVDPSGSRAVVPDYWLGGLGAPSDIAVVRLEDLRVETVREVCPAPHHAAWDPEGARIALTCPLSDEIVILDGRGREELARFPVLPPDEIGEASFDANPRARPMNLAWAPDGSRLYASLMRSGQIGAYTPQGDMIWIAPIGDSPAQIAVTPGGGWVVSANRGDGTLGLVDTSTGRGRVLALADAVHPHGVALSDDGTVGYVAYEGTTTSEGGVMAVDLREGEVLWRTAAGVFTLGVALHPGGS